MPRAEKRVRFTISLHPERTNPAPVSMGADEEIERGVPCSLRPENGLDVWAGGALVAMRVQRQGRRMWPDRCPRVQKDECVWHMLREAEGGNFCRLDRRGD